MVTSPKKNQTSSLLASRWLEYQASLELALEYLVSRVPAETVKAGFDLLANYRCGVSGGGK